MNERIAQQNTHVEFFGIDDWLEGFCGKIRADDYMQFTLDWNWMVFPQLRFNVGLSHINNDSNITIYTYKRTQQYMSLRYTF